ARAREASTTPTSTSSRGACAPSGGRSPRRARLWRRCGPATSPVRGPEVAGEATLRFRPGDGLRLPRLRPQLPDAGGAACPCRARRAPPADAGRAGGLDPAVAVPPTRPPTHEPTAPALTREPDMNETRTHPRTRTD